MIHVFLHRSRSFAAGTSTSLQCGQATDFGVRVTVLKSTLLSHFVRGQVGGSIASDAEKLEKPFAL